MTVELVAVDAERANINRRRRNQQQAAKIMKCVFRFPTKVSAQLETNRFYIRGKGEGNGGKNVSCNSTLSASNNNKEQTTANSKRPTKQPPSSKPPALSRSLCVLILVAVANSSSGSSTTNSEPLLRLGPSSSSPNSLVSQAGNEKEINGEVAAAAAQQQARRLGLLAADSADQHGERVPRQVLTTAAAVEEEMGSLTRLVSGLDASGRQEGSVRPGQSSQSSAKVLVGNGAQSSTFGAGAGQYGEDEEDEEDFPLVLAPQSRLNMDLMSHLEGDYKLGGGGKLEDEEEEEDGGQMDVFDLIPNAQLAPAKQSNEGEMAQGQAMAKRADFGLSAARTASDGAAIPSVTTTTTTGKSDANSEANNNAGGSGDVKYDARELDSPRPLRPASNSIELSVNLTKSFKGPTKTKGNGADRTGTGGGRSQEEPKNGYCVGLKHSSPMQFEWNCIRLLEMATTADLVPRPTTLRIQQTGLKIWPDLSEFQQQRLLTSIDLDNNRIESLGERPINIRAEVVNLEFNLITSIDEHIFNGSEIGTLSLSGNRQLVFIHENAFANLKNLIKLDLSSTSLTQLPTVGLHQLRQLKVQDNFALKQIPSIFVFPMLEEAQMTYSFHCCSFRYPKTHDPSAYEEHIKLQDEINAVCSKTRQPNSALEVDLRRESTVRRSPEPSGSAAASPTIDHDLSGVGGTTTASSDFEGSFFDMDRQQQPAPHSTELAASSTTQRPSATAATNSQAKNPNVTNTSDQSDGASLKKQWLLQNIECGELVQKQTDYKNIICTPKPDAFNPCEDIMGYPILRVAVWLVVACSMFGNMSVIVVLMSIFWRLSVPKFLQLNLAIGDLFMGVYLAMLAGADIATVGTYFNYALDWQHGLGCQLAGASSLFASQLSIFTLIVITFERYYTITYSIDLNMRLQLGWAARIMLIGWCYAFASAMLPIFANINSYSKTSICLPMRTVYQSDKIFILVLLIVDSCAFLIIFICYLRMYLLILKQKTDASLKERTVAMRMALLVLTDFACWAPIIFFSSTAVFGMPLISVTNSKILIVFFYPLNSMANPFLYVLSTRQYRRDLNYVISRWRHWRKNLFKSDIEKDFSNNNFINTYGAGCGPGGAMAGKYSNLAINTANLNAVAAMTGVADHLHGYRVSIDDQDKPRRVPTAERGGQQVELIKLSHNQMNDCNGIKTCRHTDNAVGQLVSTTMGHSRRGCKLGHRHHRNHHYHHHHHHQHNHQEGNDKQAPKANGLERAGSRQQPPHAQYIIRHQILPKKCTLAGSNHALTMSRTMRMITYEDDQTNGQSPPKPSRIKLEDDSKQQMRCNTVKLGFVIDSNDNSSSLAEAREAADAVNTNETRFSKLNSNQAARDLRGETERGQSVDRKAILGETNSKQQLRNTQKGMHKICVCNIDRHSQRRSPYWTTKLSIRSKDGRQQARDSPSKSAPTTTTTDANSGTNSSQTGGAKSSNEQDLDTTATLETTTTTTTGNSDDNRSGTPPAAGLESAHAGLTNGETRQHRSRHHNHHHHHHRHHRHHSRDDHRSRSRCRSRIRSGETSGRSSDVPNGPPVKTVLERITESSNTERSTTPIDQGRCEHNDRHRGHRNHRNRHHHDHHHRCREHQKRTRRVVDELEETVCTGGQQKHQVRIQVDESDKLEDKHRKHQRDCHNHRHHRQSYRNLDERESISEDNIQHDQPREMTTAVDLAKSSVALTRPVGEENGIDQ